MQPVSLRTDLSDTKLAQLEYSAIQALIGQAQKEVQEASETIFGSETDNSEEAKEKRTKIVKFFKTRKVQIGEREVTSTDSDGNLVVTKVPVYKDETYDDENLRQTKTWSAGEFGSHIGYDPVLKESPNIDDGLEQLWQDRGMGELGRLMRSYIYWSMKESQGWASVNKPMWDKPAWDDRSSWFKAPTIRGITDIGVTIAASVMLPGAGSLLMNAALNLADDAVFTMLDVGGGYKSWEAAGLEFGKKALSSAVNVGVGQVFSPAVTALNSTPGVSGVIGRTMVGGMQSFTTSTASSAINAITWDAEHGLGWSSDAFNAGVQGGLISAATGMTSSFTSGMLNLGLEGFVGSTYANAATLSNTIGSLAGQGVNYALTGDFTLNVLNFGMFGIQDRNGNLVKNGLLELHLGKNGATMNVGMGGADVSLGTVAQSIAGLDAWRVNAELWTSKQDEAHKYTSGMRTLYSVGGAKELALYQELLSGKTNIEELASGDYKAKTEANGDGTKTIYLGQGSLADGSRFGLNILLAHEAYRNGIDDGVEGQRIETQQAVLGHIGAAFALAQTYGMGSIGEAMTGEVNTYLEALKSNNYDALGKLLAGYDSSGDYWRLVRDYRTGAFGFIEDGELDFDLSILGMGRDISPEEMAKMVKAMEFAGLPKLEASRDMVFQSGNISKEELMKQYDEFQKKNPHFSDRDFQAFFEGGTNSTSFRNGILSFVGASVALEDAITYIEGSNSKTNPINEQKAQKLIANVMSSLGDVQDSGLLIRKNASAINTSRLINLGTKNNPLYVPVELGAGQLVHEASSLPGVRYLSNIEAFKNHPGIDLRGVGGKNVVVSANSTNVTLAYNSVYGLMANNSYTYNGTVAKDQLAHLKASSTFMSFLKNFGTEGITFDGQTLHGLTAGTIIGKVGNTGTSFGAHLDWNMYRATLDEYNLLGKLKYASPLEDTLFGDYLKHHITTTVEARYLSGLSGDPQTVLDNPSNRASLKKYFDTTRDVAWFWKMSLKYGVEFYE
ncbi:M23 family metallopeptidase [Gracilinema caldarium]|uniref:Uncharacterized protein n=1 Tax=Gracilinema caldarium (strain ATCC 51460 / DSM 7334 / H1) TaxID=744872 RepID=F8EXJ0_GRAC1|nr:M23 family metallopeptidase [Gracilinema caldarium]AEJ19217.1 hypothetical protein Spica_1069 [Gracilinema caldarium DSM 7334]